MTLGVIVNCTVMNKQGIMAGDKKPLEIIMQSGKVICEAYNNGRCTYGGNLCSYGPQARHLHTMNMQTYSRNKIIRR